MCAMLYSLLLDKVDGILNDTCKSTYGLFKNRLKLNQLFTRQFVIVIHAP